MDETKQCKHCKEPIRHDEVFGWYHGNIHGGWNTTCNDGDAETRAEPTDWINPESVNHIWDCASRGPWYQMQLDGEDIYDVKEAVEQLMADMMPSDHKHNFSETHISSTGRQVVHFCPGKPRNG